MNKKIINLILSAFTLGVLFTSVVKADNFEISEGSGTNIGADDIGGGVLVQRFKLALGADGAYDMDVDSGQQVKASSIPVTIASDQGSEITWNTLTEFAHGSISGTYATALTNSNNLKIIILKNKLDGDVYISFDGTNNHILLEVNETVAIDMSTNNRYESSNISVKHVSVSGSGTLYITSGY